MGAPPEQEQQPPETDDWKKPAADPDAASGVPPSTTLQAYLNLIQQYLGVLELENATFLAERCVAAYPSHTQAVYLLALCHYRQGSPGRARTILSNSKASPPTAAMEYLEALCSYDLHDYATAEDTLLRTCRTLYHRRTVVMTSDVMVVNNLHEWILDTSVSLEWSAVLLVVCVLLFVWILCYAVLLLSLLYIHCLHLFTLDALFVL